MPCVRFEPMIPASEPAETVLALDRSATVTGILSIYRFNIQFKVVKNSICRNILILRSRSCSRYLRIHNSHVKPHPVRINMYC
jgi:hypothetical protein